MGRQAVSFLACFWYARCIAASWPDCSMADVTQHGPFGSTSQFNATAADGTLVFNFHPQTGANAPHPVMIFSHGSTGEYAMYQDAIERYVSHGFVVIFPHIKGPKEDTSPLTLDPSGDFTIKGVEYAQTANSNTSSPLHKMLDLKNMILVGHSMGASSTIMAAKRLPAGTAKAAVSQHPGICGPFGPPPWPSTWMPADFEAASAKMPVILTTATNDAAFWPQPHTAEHELGCFHKATDGSASKSSTAFAQFNATACAEDGQGGRYDRKWPNAGHDCPMKKDSVETVWVLVASKLYTQLGGDPSSNCHAMLWGKGGDSIQKDPSVEKFVINEPTSSESTVLV